MCVGIQSEAFVYTPSFFSSHPITSCALHHIRYHDSERLSWCVWKTLACFHARRVINPLVVKVNPLVVKVNPLVPLKEFII